MSGSANNTAPSLAGRAFVLDDEPQIGSLICKILHACDIASRQFTSPGPFMAELKISPPDLVLVDLSLGQSDAVEVIRHLEGCKFQGKVLLISGRDETTLNEITQIGEKRGLLMLPPLKKPFRPKDVKERLTGHLAGPPRPKVPESHSKGDAPKKVRVQVIEALRNNWLEVWYEPKFELKSLSVCGAEVLIRARHPMHGILTPENLLPPAGDAAYQPLTKFVVERAMADWCEFARQGILLRLAVNAPISVIHTPAFIALVRSVLPRDAKFCGLIVEVTEDEVIRDSAWAREVASQLKLYNVDLSIDDFGAGYASLSRLNDLPFAEVKIDRSFVSGCASDPLKHSLCQTVVDLAHRFGATACAEGVETVDDVRALMAMRCDSAQGYLFAKAMPAANFVQVLQSGTATNTVRGLLQAASDESGLVAQSA